jgi:DNA-binding response OmpR family regulator
VDDEHVVADTIAEILGQNGFDPTVAYDYDHAFSAAESSAPDILITDVVMIGKTGVDLAIKIRDRFPATRIFLLSGQAVTSSVLNNARERGYDFELLAKPLHPTALLKALRGHGN